MSDKDILIGLKAMAVKLRDNYGMKPFAATAEVAAALIERLEARVEQLPLLALTTTEVVNVFNSLQLHGRRDWQEELDEEIDRPYFISRGDRRDWLPLSDAVYVARGMLEAKAVSDSIRAKEPARRGFTLVELLVAIAIISMLIVIAGAALVGVTADMRLKSGAGTVKNEIDKAHALAQSSGGSGIRLVPDNADSLARLADGTLDPTQTLTYRRIVPLVQPLPYKTGLASINTSGWPAGFVPAYGRLVLEESLVDADGHRAEPTSWWWAVRVGDTLEILDRKYTVVGPMLVGPADGNPTCHVNWGFPTKKLESPLTRLDPVTGKTMPVQWLYLADRTDNDRDGYTDEGWDGIDNDLDGYTDEDDEWEADQWQPDPALACTATRHAITPRLVAASAGGALLPASVMIDATGWATSRDRSHLPVDPFTGEVDLIFNKDGAADSPSIYGRPANRPLNEGYLHLWVSGVKDVASPPLAQGEGRLVTLDLRTGRTTSGYADAGDVAGTIVDAEGAGR